MTANALIEISDELGNLDVSRALLANPSKKPICWANGINNLLNLPARLVATTSNPLESVFSSFVVPACRGGHA
jgi:hypothetical protein